MKYIKRSVEDLVNAANKTFKCVLVTGARQTGKSTLLRHVYPDIPYVTFDDPVLLSETRREPGLFFINNRPPVIIDEIQYITDLFPYIKIECDNSMEKGIIHMTGSQHFRLMAGVSESLAGRVGIFELSGLSLREYNNDNLFIPFLPDRDFILNRKPFKKINYDLWDIIHRGSYPALLDNETDWELFYGSYVSTYIDRDINDVKKVRAYKYVNGLHQYGLAD